MKNTAEYLIPELLRLKKIIVVKNVDRTWINCRHWRLETKIFLLPYRFNSQIQHVLVSKLNEERKCGVISFTPSLLVHLFVLIKTLYSCIEINTYTENIVSSCIIHLCIKLIKTSEYLTSKLLRLSKIHSRKDL